MIEVELPDGSIAEFPDGTPPETIKGALQRRFGGGKQAAPNPSLFRADSDFGDKAGFTLGKFSPTLGMAAARDMFGSHESAGKYLAEKTGGTLEQTEQGPVVRLPSGERYYVNDPGLDSTDVANFTGNAAAYTPAGRLAATGATMGGKMLLGGAAAAGTDATMQAGFNDEFDAQRTALAGTFGVLAEPIGAALKAGGSKLVSMLKSDKTLANAGREIASHMGLQDVPDDVAIELGKRAREIAGGATPESALAESELGLRLTRGQKLGSERGHSQIRREQMLRETGDSLAGRTLRSNDERNIEAVNRGVANLVGDVSGGNPAGSVADAMDSVRSAVRGEADALKGRIGDAYEAVRSGNAGVRVEGVQGLPARLKAAVSDFDVTPELAPATTRAIKSVEESVAALPKDAKASVKLRAVEAQRKRLNSLIDSASNKADRAAALKVKAEYDNWLDDMVDQALVSGDPEVIGALKEARGLRAEFSRRFERTGAGKDADRLVQKILSDEASPDELANLMLGASQISKPATERFVGAVKKALGDNPEAWDQIRGSVLMRATTNKAGETAGPQALMGNLKQLLTQRKGLMKELFSQEEVSRISRMVMALDPLVPKGMLGRSAGTAERTMGFVNELVGGLPFGRQLVSALSAPARAGAAGRALAPIQPRGNGLPQAAGMGAASQYDR